MPSAMIDRSARLATRKMTGISRTRPISKNIGRPMIAPIAAIDHGSIRGLDLLDDRVDDLVGTAGVGQQLAEHRAESDQDADALDGVADAGAEAADDVEHVAPGDRADRAASPRIRREERVQLEERDQHDEHRDADERGGDELPGAGDGLDRLGRRGGDERADDHAVSSSERPARATNASTISAGDGVMSKAQPFSSSCNGSRVFSCDVQQRRRHEVVAMLHARLDQVVVTGQVQELRTRRSVDEDVAIGAA